MIREKLRSLIYIVVAIPILVIFLFFFADQFQRLDPVCYARGGCVETKRSQDEPLVCRTKFVDTYEYHACDLKTWTEQKNRHLYRLPYYLLIFGLPSLISLPPLLFIYVRRKKQESLSKH